MSAPAELPDHVQAALAAVDAADAAHKHARAELRRLRVEVIEPAEERSRELSEAFEAMVDAVIPEIVRCVPPLSPWESMPGKSARKGDRVVLAVHDEGVGRWSGAILIAVPGLVRNVIGWASAPSEAEARGQLDAQWVALGGRLDP